jgi:predicted RNase H-like HicB family nuclease
MFQYPAKIRRGGMSFMVSFPDLPGAYSQGDDREDAARHAVDALETGLNHLIRNGNPLPGPSTLRRGLVPIEVNSDFESKLILV